MSVNLSIRFVSVLAVVAVVFFQTGFWPIFQQSLADAFWQVGAFVAVTLWGFYWLEKKLKTPLGDILSRKPWLEVPVAAFLGGLPGCGGAVVVMTQYARGYLHFGSVVAVLTATMGDAAFLLIAQKPLVGLLIMGGGMLVGTLAGYVVQITHSRDFLRRPEKAPLKGKPCVSLEIKPKAFWLSWPWNWSLLAVVPIAFLIAFQVDLEAISTQWVGFDAFVWAGFLLAVITMLWWIIFSPNLWQNSFISTRKVSDLVLRDTAFVLFWVVLAYVSYEAVVFWTKIDLGSLFGTIRWMTPLIAIFIGFIPGCGPQILITSLYLQGLIPLSAQLGNAISNDGDALFPVLALHPRAAVVATLYSAVPALLVAYGYFWLVE